MEDSSVGLLLNCAVAARKARMFADARLADCVGEERAEAIMEATEAAMLGEVRASKAVGAYPAAAGGAGAAAAAKEEASLAEALPSLLL